MTAYLSPTKTWGWSAMLFSNDILSALPSGTMAVGHVRYGTTGGTNRNNCQPIEVNHQKGRMALAHNGNLSNATKLRNELELSGAIFHTTSDTETIAYIVTRERLNAPSIEDALSRAMNTLDGAYSLVLMSPQKVNLCKRSLWFSDRSATGRLLTAHISSLLNPARSKQWAEKSFGMWNRVKS